MGKKRGVTVHCEQPLKVQHLCLDDVVAALNGLCAEGKVLRERSANGKTVGYTLNARRESSVVVPTMTELRGWGAELRARRALCEVARE